MTSYFTITAGPPLMRPEEQGPRLPGSAPSHSAQAMLPYMAPSLMSHTGLYTWGHTHCGSAEMRDTSLTFSNVKLAHGKLKFKSDTVMSVLVCPKKGLCPNLRLVTE